MAIPGASTVTRKVGSEIMERLGKVAPDLLSNKQTIDYMGKGLQRQIDSGAITVDALESAAKTKQLGVIQDQVNFGQEALVKEARNGNLNKVITPEPELTDVDRLKQSYETGSGSQIRGFNAKVASGFGEEGAKLPKTDYASLGQHFMGRGGPGAITAIHHGFGLDDMMGAIRAHPSWKFWHEGANPIVKRIQEAGFDFGNHTKNLTDVTDTLPNAFRQAEVVQAV